MKKTVAELLRKNPNAKPYTGPRAHLKETSATNALGTGFLGMGSSDEHAS